MGRTKNQIKETMTTAFVQDPVVIEKYQLTPGQSFEQEFSVVSIENILFETIAFCLFIFEGILDAFRSDVEERVAQSRPHTKGWYRQLALNFRFGQDLIPETDQYDDTGLTDEEIAASKIVAQASPVKIILSGAGAIRMKVARWVGDELGPLLEEQVIALQTYFNDHVSDAGTTVIVSTGEPDDLKLKIDAYYDALIIGADGVRLDGTNPEPLKEGIRAFLSSIDFDGKLKISRLESALEQIKGFEILNVKQAASKFAGYTYEDVAPGVGPIDELRQADAGYFKLDESVLEINYIPIEA